MGDAFFEQLGATRYGPTEWSIGPWGRDSLHAGPPAALLGRAIEQAGDPGMQVARITFEILRPVPLQPLDLSVEVVRPGRKIRLVTASLGIDGSPVMLATGWLMRTQPMGVDPAPAPGVELPGPTESPPALDDDDAQPDYLHAMEWRFARGSFFEPGPAAAWTRMRHPLLQGEPVSPLTRVLIAADSGNGISAALDFTRWLFVNTDLTVHLHRMPRGEWICLDATTVVEAEGVGLATSVLSDRDGPVARGLQSLFVSPRS